MRLPRMHPHMLRYTFVTTMRYDRPHQPRPASELPSRRLTASST